MPDRTNRRSILVIDHDARVNDTLRMLLADAGYQAVAAPDLDAAIHLLGSLKLDLVITNYMEPAYRRGDRWPVLEMIRHLVDPGTPLVVMTTSTEELNQSACQLEVAAIVGKPFEVDDLLQHIARAMEARGK